MPEESWWEDRWRRGEAGWDLGGPAPPFVALLDSPAAPRPGAMAVVGCGAGHEVLLFARHGFDVVGFDFAETAIELARRNAVAAGVAASFERIDFFELARLRPGQFDYVLEHAFFTAIEPRDRGRYEEVVHALLRPGGELIGLFWQHERPGGPPHGTSEAELRALFGARFQIERLGLAEGSVERRRGEELLARFRKPAAAGSV